MQYDRILTGDVCNFFEEPSPERDVIVRYVQENLQGGARSVALCFRGNYATLYYRCRQLLRIYKARRGLVGEFDFRHARFTEEYAEILSTLSGMGVDISHFSDAPGEDSRRYVKFALRGFGEENLGRVLDIYRALIDDYVDPEKHEHCFDRKSVCRKPKNFEKDRQQQLYAAYFMQDSLMYYDLEYTEHDSKEKNVPGRFDLLGLRREENGYTLLLSELKSTYAAIGGKSGLAAHEADYLRYLESDLLPARKKEACETVLLFTKLFAAPYPEQLTPENITSVKAQFVFSDDVIRIGKAYKPSDPRIEKAYFADGKLV